MSEQPEQVELTLESLAARIAVLETQNAELKQELKTKTETIMRDLVQISAQQLQMLFENEVMAGSVASNLLTAMQNALLYKASGSKNRKPTLLIVKDYVPGSSRIALSEEGVLSLEDQAADAADAEAPWVSRSAVVDDPELCKVFIQLVQSYGLEPGQYGYAITDLALQDYRQSLTEKIASQAAQVETKH